MGRINSRKKKQAKKRAKFGQSLAASVDVSEARHNGALARYRGKPLKDCPYRGKHGEAWREGWKHEDEAIARHMKATDEAERWWTSRKGL